MITSDRGTGTLAAPPSRLDEATDPTGVVPDVLLVDGLSKRFRTPKQRQGLLAGIRTRLGGGRDDEDDDEDVDEVDDDEDGGRRDQAEWALADIDFRLQRGRTLGVVGPISSGKTTLLRVVAGLTTPSAGAVVRRGRIVPLLDSLTLLLQDTTGARNVVLLARILGIPTNLVRRELDEIFEFADLAGRESGGRKSFDRDELRRLVVAVALRTEGELILLDSDLGDGGTGFQRRCLDELDRRLEAGCALIQTGRELDSVRRYCDDVIWLEGGQIVHRGSREAVARAVREDRAAARPKEAPRPTAEALRFAEFLDVALGEERAADALAAATVRAVAQGIDEVGWPAVAEAVGYDLDEARAIVARLDAQDIRSRFARPARADLVTIVSARLTTTSGRALTTIRTDEKAVLEVKARTASPGVELGCRVYLNGLDGGRLLFAYPDRIRVERSGTIRFRATVPPGSFVGSGYRGTVVVSAQIDGQETSVHRRDLLSITVSSLPEDAIEATALDALEPFMPGEGEEPSFEQLEDLDWHVDVEPA